MKEKKQLTMKNEIQSLHHSITTKYAASLSPFRGGAGGDAKQLLYSVGMHPNRNEKKAK
jgi:hypothetical protein